MIEQAEPAGPIAGQHDFAAARHEQAVRALRTGRPRHAGRLLHEALAVAPEHAGAWAVWAVCPCPGTGDRGKRGRR